MEFRRLVSKLSILQKNKRFFDMDIKELREVLIKKYVRVTLELPRPDDPDNGTCFIINGIRNYLKLRARLDQDLSYLTDVLLQKLIFSKNLLYIATMQGVDRMQLIDLLSHYIFLAVNAECLRKVYWSICFEEKVFNDIQFEISQLQLKIELVDPQFHATFEQTHPPTSSSLGFPRTNQLGSIDFFLENLKELTTSEAGSITFPMHQIERVQEDLRFLRSFLCKIVKQRNQNVKFQTLWDRVMLVAYKSELVIDSVMLGDGLECLELDTVAGDIEHMKTEALQISDSIKNDKEVEEVSNNFIPLESQLDPPALTEVLVGLDEEVKTITKRLIGGSKQLDIVSIVGMAGLGKTTLANTIYHHPSILGRFHIRAWCTVSQVYSKHNLVVQMLCSIESRSPEQYVTMNEDDLTEKLRKVLLRNIYLIVLDDVWDIGAWNLLKHALPENANGSRILFTSRFQHLYLQFKPDSEPYCLRQLINEECFLLLQRKIFGKQECPPALINVLMQVANKCKGLPHTVVIFAGILSKTKPDCWQEFADSLSSSISIKIEPLELSYIHLPEYLKPCLLYLGAFREDEDIPAQKLSWLWISEGFVQKTEGKSLEDVAEDYLKDLIGRSLVIVTKQRTLAGAKTCRLHDLVHEFCVAKSKEESFLQILHGFNNFSTFTGLCPHRLCIHLTKADELEKPTIGFPELRCLLFFRYARGKLIELRDGSLLFPMLKLLRVLDIGDVRFGDNFPMELFLLVHLRYLAILLHLHMKSIPSAIDNLSKLETFLVGGSNGPVALPNTIWNIKTLRHLKMTWPSLTGFILPTGDVEDSPDLEHLDTFSLEIDCYERLQKMLKKLPNIRRLKCVGTGGYVENCSGILKLDNLSRLESLRLKFFWEMFEFPMNLKKLTLSHNYWPWSEISTIGKLPNLEVLQ